MGITCARPHEICVVSHQLLHSFLGSVDNLYIAAHGLGCKNLHSHPIAYKFGPLFPKL